ncbi:hypothetical protein MA785_000794 [Vibrio parahaemolyticus]|nr:hypothetical protein [Vibrio parahaemolyticus]EJR2787903.1 hypothetical protein [Vibrio parahaemolyticus]
MIFSISNQSELNSILGDYEDAVWERVTSEVEYGHEDSIALSIKNCDLTGLSVVEFYEALYDQCSIFPITIDNCIMTKQQYSVLNDIFGDDISNIHFIKEVIVPQSPDDFVKHILSDYFYGIEGIQDNQLLVRSKPSKGIMSIYSFDLDKLTDWITKEATNSSTKENRLYSKSSNEIAIVVLHEVEAPLEMRLRFDEMNGLSVDLFNRFEYCGGFSAQKYTEKQFKHMIFNCPMGELIRRRYIVGNRVNVTHISNNQSAREIFVDDFNFEIPNHIYLEGSSISILERCFHGEKGHGSITLNYDGRSNIELDRLECVTLTGEYGFNYLEINSNCSVRFKNIDNISVIDFEKINIRNDYEFENCNVKDIEFLLPKAVQTNPYLIQVNALEFKNCRNVNIKFLLESKRFNSELNTCFILEEDNSFVVSEKYRKHIIPVSNESIASNYAGVYTLDSHYSLVETLDEETYFLIDEKTGKLVKDDDSFLKLTKEDKDMLVNGYEPEPRPDFVQL